MTLNNIKGVLGSLSVTERKLLPFLVKTIDYNELLKESGLQEVEVQRALMYLSNKNVLEVKTETIENIVLDKNGQIYKKEGLPEKKLLIFLKDNKEHSFEEIQKKANMQKDEVAVSIGVLKKKNTIITAKTEKGLVLKINDNGKKLIEKQDLESEFLKLNFPLRLDSLKPEQKLAFENLKSRKNIIKIEKQKNYTIKILPIGEELLKSKEEISKLSEVEDTLTSQMIKTGSWKQKKFRVYDITSGVPYYGGGRRHPLSESKNIIRDVFIQMGFKEMSSPWVDTQFWCMDSMWIPQDHPARDVQDTFFIGKKGKLPDKKLVAEVRSCQENGGKTGSIGHQTPWDEEMSKELILRTHSTAATFRKFGEFLKSKDYSDCKYFYIANNFRNEAIDSTHLAEFLQAEGFIMADNLTLADLMGFIKEFYAKLGITKIKFKPTFNPYTEPSMEAHYYDEKKKKWYALINSGIFRPEALAPFGIKKRVIAWGMGASRIATILYDKNNLKELVGPECDFNWIQSHKLKNPKSKW